MTEVDGPDGRDGRAGRGGRDHAGPALSALLDGELAPLEEAAVRSHLDGCEACARELDRVRSARWMLRTLPGVEGPVVASPPVSSVGSQQGLALASVMVSVAMAVALLIGAGGQTAQALAPGVIGAVENHAVAVSAMGTGVAAAPTSFGGLAAASVPAPYRVPATLVGGYKLVDARQADGGLHLLYRQGRYGLSVFEEVGRLKTDALPAGGRRLDLAEARGWRWEAPQIAGRVVVLEYDGLVLTVVGDELGDAVLDAARSLPGPRSLSTMERLRKGCAEVLAELSPSSQS